MSYAVLSKNMTNSSFLAPCCPPLRHFPVFSRCCSRWPRWLRMTHQVVLAAPMLTVKVVKLNGEAWPKGAGFGLVFNDQGT